MGDVTSEASKDVVRQFFDAVLAGDRDRVRALCAPDAAVWAAATPPRWGQAGSIEEWFAHLDNYYPAGAGGGHMAFGPFFADGEHVSVQLQSYEPLINGRVYEGHYHFYFQVRDGRIVLIREYFDTLHLVESNLGTSAVPEFDFGAVRPERGQNLFVGARDSLD